MIRRIVGITGISLWAGLIVAAVLVGFHSAKKAPYELGIKPTPGQKQQKQVSKDNNLEKLSRGLVDSLVNGNYTEAVENFDSTMKKALPAEKLQEVWNSIIAQAGPFKEQLGARKENILQYDVMFVTCQFENSVLDAKVVFDSKKKIAGLFFVPSQNASQ